MTNPKKTTEEAEQEKARMFTHYAGKAGSLEEFAEYLLKKCGELYSIRKDNEAGLMRAVADEAARKAAEYRNKQGEYR